MFTKEEVAAELARRAEEERRRDRQKAPLQDAEADANCIHCGRPFNSVRAAAGAHGLCDDCHFRD